MAKLLYKRLGLLFSVLGGLVATRVFSAVWKAVRHEDETPSSKDAHRSWSDVLVAAALEGAIFGLVKAAADRGGAIGFQRATGAWPGDE